MKINTQNDFPDYQYNAGNYKYQPALTKKLKVSSTRDIDQEWVNEVVLWKVNRYVALGEQTVRLLNDPQILATHLSVNYTEEVLKSLLTTSGIRLPMASTMLRFRNPLVYQIIDQRAYRVVTGKPLRVSNSNSEKAIKATIKLYLEYLETIREIALRRNWNFAEMDQLLYVMDLAVNSHIPIKS